MRVEIIFHTSGRPTVHENVYAVYTKGDLLCVHNHQPHLGTTRTSGLLPDPPAKEGKA